MLRDPKSWFLLGSLICLIGTGWVYATTLATTVQGFDSAELTVGAYTLGIVHPTGYPLFMLIGNLVAHLPIGGIAFRVNLLSAVLGILSTWLFYILLYQQTENWLVSLTVSAMFALAPHVWAQAIKAEVYTLHTLLITSVLLVWYLGWRSDRPASSLLFFAILGLASANHATTVFLSFAILLCTDWKDRRWRSYTLLGIGLGAAITTLSYLYFPWRAAQPLFINYIQEYFQRDPRQPIDLLWLISGRAFRCAFQPPWDSGQFLNQLLRLAVFIWDGTLGLAPILGIWGWNILRKTAPVWNRLLTIYCLANVAYFCSYQVVDKEAMFLPLYLVIDLWIAQGLIGLARWVESRSRRLTFSRANLLINLALLAVLGIGAFFDWPALDLSSDSRAYDYATQVLESAPADAIIVNHWATAAVFDYLRVIEGFRPDVRSFNLDFFFLAVQKSCQAQPEPSLNSEWYQWLGSQVAQRSRLCFIEPLPPIPDSYSYEKNGVCWELVSR